MSCTFLCGLMVVVFFVSVLSFDCCCISSPCLNIITSLDKGCAKDELWICNTWLTKYGVDELVVSDVGDWVSSSKSVLIGGASMETAWTAASFLDFCLGPMSWRSKDFQRLVDRFDP